MTHDPSVTHDPSMTSNPSTPQDPMGPDAVARAKPPKERESKAWLIYAAAFLAMVGVLYWSVPEGGRVASTAGDPNTGVATAAPGEQAPGPGRRAPRQ
jgi:hypothetical protein